MNTSHVSNDHQKLCFPPLPNNIFVNTIVNPYLDPKDIAHLLSLNTACHQYFSKIEFWKNFSLTKLSNFSLLTLKLMGISFPSKACVYVVGKLSLLSLKSANIYSLEFNGKDFFSSTFDKIYFWNWDDLKRDFDNLVDNSYTSTAPSNIISIIPSHANIYQEIERVKVAGFIDKNIVTFVGTGIQIRGPNGQIQREWFALSGPPILCATVSDKYIFSGFECNISIWDTNGYLINILKGHQKPITCLTIIDETKIISGSEDQTIHIYDLTTSFLDVLSGCNAPISCVKAIDKFLISMTKDGTIQIWKGPKYKLIHALYCNTTCLEIIDQTMFVSGSSDCTIRFWAISSGKLIYSFPLKSNPTCIKLIDDRLVIGCENVRVYILSLNTLPFDET